MFLDLQNGNNLKVVFVLSSLPFAHIPSAWVALWFSLNNYLSQYAAESLESTDVSFSDSSYLLPNLEGQ